MSHELDRPLSAQEHKLKEAIRDLDKDTALRTLAHVTGSAPGQK